MIPGPDTKFVYQLHKNGCGGLGIRHCLVGSFDPDSVVLAQGLETVFSRSVNVGPAGQRQGVDEVVGGVIGGEDPLDYRHGVDGLALHAKVDREGADRVDGKLVVDGVVISSDGLEIDESLLTGEADPDLATRLMRAGALDYLDKAEVTPSGLARAIRYAEARQAFQAEPAAASQLNV